MRDGTGLLPHGEFFQMPLPFLQLFDLLFLAPEFFQTILKRRLRHEYTEEIHMSGQFQLGRHAAVRFRGRTVKLQHRIEDSLLGVFFKVGTSAPL